MMRKARLAIRKVNVECSTAEYSSQVVIPNPRAMSLTLIPSAPLYLGCSRSVRPLPRGFTGHVAHPSRSIETRSLPTFTRSYPSRFTFYVADPVSSIVSRLLPQRSTATSRLYRPCRSSQSLHSRAEHLTLDHVVPIGSRRQ